MQRYPARLQLIQEVMYGSYSDSFCVSLAKIFYSQEVGKEERLKTEDRAFRYHDLSLSLLLENDLLGSTLVLSSFMCRRRETFIS